VTGLSARVEAFDGGVCLALTGELDAFDAPRLRELFEQATAPVLVLDLTRVSFLDSTVLGAIVGLLRRQRQEGGELRVVLPDGEARRIFEVTGLDTALEPWPTRAAAIDG
jgi:anti-sigma B factor antagonist